MQTELITYLKKNWFKVCFVAILIFIAFKKDLSFQINVKTPAPTEEKAPKSSTPAQSVKEGRKKESFTENLEKPLEANTSSVMDRFKFSPLGSTQELKPDVYEVLSNQEKKVVRNYLERFSRVALMEQDKFGIPASIILGNALLLSQAGANELAVEGNNHFALKCTHDWEGETGQYHGQCFRHYENAWTSFRDHSYFLSTGEWGSRFNALKGGNYKVWARALEKAQFANEKDYGRQLIQVIEDFELNELDK